MNTQNQAQDGAAGVKALIDRLRNEGVSAGRSEADRIVAEAQARANDLVAKAEAKAKHMVDEAQKETEALKSAANDALEVAARDTMLNLRAQIASRLDDEVTRLLSEATADPEMLQQMIIEVAGRARRGANVDAEKKVEVILPETVVGVEELRQKPEELKEGTLTHFVLAAAGNVLRKGVEFSSAPGFGGIKLRLVESNVEIDLTDQAIAGALLEHLQPRFRAVMEGIVK